MQCTNHTGMAGILAPAIRNRRPAHGKTAPACEYVRRYMCAEDTNPSLTLDSRYAKLRREGLRLRIVKESRVKQYMVATPGATPSLSTWLFATRRADWHSLADTRQTFGSADLVGRLTVFNIKGNDYRLIVHIDYEHHLVFIRAFLTHTEYDKGNWKHDPWF